MDSFSIPTSAGWAPAAPLVVCNLGWNHWLAQAYKMNPSPCNKHQWFYCLFFLLVHLCQPQLGNSSSWSYQPSLEIQAFFTVGSDMPSETEQLQYVLQTWSRKPLKTPNNILTERKMRDWSLTFFGILFWQTSWHPKQPSQRSRSSWKDQQTAHLCHCLGLF